MPDNLTDQYLNAVSYKELSLFEIIPGNNVLINVNPPEFTVLAVTESYLLETGKKREELIGRSMFEIPG